MFSGFVGYTINHKSEKAGREVLIHCHLVHAPIGAIGLKAVVWRIEATIPTYHTRAMRKQFVHDFQLLVHLEPKVMREMYRCFTGDSSASSNFDHCRCNLLNNLESTLKMFC